VSLVLASLSGIGSAFVGTNVYPLTGGQIVLSETPKEPEKRTQTVQNLKTELTKQFGSEVAAKNITEFIETPVMEWKKIAPTFREIVKKYSGSTTHPDQNKCPPKLVEICKLVSTKFSHIRNYVINETADPLGDQTSEALAILNGIV